MSPLTTILRVLSPVLIVGTMGTIAALLSMYQTGELAESAEREGTLKQAIIQKEQMAAQSLQIAREAEEEARRLEEEAKKAHEQLSEIQKQFRESQEQVNDLLVKIRETANDDPELQVWGNNRLPAAVPGVYHAAASADSPGTDCGDEESLCAPASDTGSDVPGW